MNKKHLLLGLLTTSLIACYSPDPFEAESLNSSGSSVESEIGKVYPVDGDAKDGEQTCNPSVSNDPVKFPASMLWLNFGKINVGKHDSHYSVEKVSVHDRLTVSDTANDVKWFLMRDVSKGECEFQDPEWSTHADYIVALRGYDVNGSKACEDLDYGIFAVRTSDKEKFWFYEKKIIGEATPHVWVDPMAEAPEDGDDSTIEGFFGTKNVRLTYIEGEQYPQRKIVFVDYANGGKAVRLKKPSDRENWNIDSPLISPDGKFVVYNMKKSENTWEAYVQELSENSKAVKIELTKDMMSEPAQPHWFQFNDRLFVLWAEFPQSSEMQMLNKHKLNEASSQDGSVGRTVMREIRLNAGAPADLAVEWVGNNIEIAPVPMTGGRSPDGKFLATGTNNAYLIKLP